VNEHPTVEQVKELRELGWTVVTTLSRGICATRPDAGLLGMARGARARWGHRQ
jgi:hypothetical protein